MPSQSQSQKWGYPPALQYSVGSPGGLGRLSSAVVLGHIIFCLLGDLCPSMTPGWRLTPFCCVRLKPHLWRFHASSFSMVRWISMQKSAELGQNPPENPKLIDGGFKFLLQGPSRGGSQKNLKGGSLRLVVVGHTQW
jgi:hypothetical protein